jgi:hypothetical protein
MNAQIIGNFDTTRFDSHVVILLIVYLFLILWLADNTVDTTFFDEVGHWHATGWWFSPGTRVSNKTDLHDIAEILLKVALSTINLPTVFASNL